MRRLAAFFLVCSLAAADDESFRVYAEHPRLLLTAQRLRLLRRERERQSMRWEQLNRLMAGGVAMPEAGFAWALNYEVTQDRVAAAKAFAAVSARGAGLRQLALVYDWCQDAMTDAQRASLRARLRARLATGAAPTNLSGWRDRVLAAIAIGGSEPELAERILRDAVKGWWRGHYAPALGSAAESPHGGELFPMLEILHAIRDNLNIDLREARVGWFERLAEFHVASHYPAPYPAAENEYRIPMYSGGRAPDLDLAALSRAAGLALVAFDNNATSSQYLQGWLIQDQYLLRGPFGAPYEFLWANPYQPGLAYMHLPLIFHDPSTGTLFVRGDWDDDSPWFGLLAGHAQLFTHGAVTALGLAPSAAAMSFDTGSATVVHASAPLHVDTKDDAVFVVGLRPEAGYLVEADGEEMTELVTDSAGTLEIRFPKPREARVFVHESPFPLEPKEPDHDSR